MGNAFSSVLVRHEDVTGESEVNMASSDDSVEQFHDTIDEIDNTDQEDRNKAKEKEMEEFRRQLQIKREQRREILDRHKTEKRELEISLENERKAKLEAYETNKMLRELLTQNNIEIPEDLRSSKETSDITDTIITMKDEFEKLKANNNKLRRDLAEANMSLQGAYSDIANLQGQNTESIKQINALKEVISVSKTMLQLREQQLNELKNKLDEIERSLADREANMLSTDLRQEYERQLQNIRTLRGLYEERARLAEVTRQSLVRDLEEQKLLKQAEINKAKDLETKVEELESRVDELQEIISNKNNQIFTCQDETRGLKAEMSAVNKLFSQVLLGYKNEQDLDQLVHRLEENHGLLTHMAENENDAEASTALPKLLLEIVSQVDEIEQLKRAEEAQKEECGESSAESKSIEEPEPQNPTNTTAEEIVQNLPKVWRVLMELLSHQSTPDENAPEKVTTCYKTVETKSGPVLVPSVSQTYIRLKDLILEKLTLIKEVNRMKQLNGHLETRLEEQERRLCLVTTELSKTWHVVGRLRRHHHQLHTHEKILKYELQQKRKLLNELKEELEYCREKCDQAREKNTQSERDWRKLRAEFTSRKTKSSASFNNSAESGYSDERPSDESSESNDESEYLNEPLIRSKKKLKKSFETILDSSTDFNLAAEREDPASDLLDVADLPLDTQDGDHHEVSDSCNSESLLKSDKVCEETEDELCELANDSCTEEIFTANFIQNNDNTNKEDKIVPSSSIAQTIPPIDPAAILKSIREQSERLARKDKKLERLEKSGAALLQKTQSTVKISDQISSTLDHLLNRPTSSRLSDHEIQNTSLDSVEITESSQNLTDNKKQTNENTVPKNDSDTECSNITSDGTTVLIATSGSNVNLTDILETENSSLNSTNLSTDKNVNENIVDSTISNETKIDLVDQPSTSNNIELVDFKAILESVKRQNERLAIKDERLKKLENNCAEVVNNISKTLTTGEEIIEKLENLHKANSNSDDKTDEVNNEPPSRDSSEPSTSGELDHEARFAARDLRLKRLEEQTKSLVNKVNKTTSKGVKIHYKLEELHNIYGSENSRAGTPSDNEDSRQNSNQNEDPAEDPQETQEDNTE